MPASDASDAATTLAPAPTAEAATSHAVTAWWQTTSLVEVRGTDAVSFLAGLCTANVDDIGHGEARLACFLDGRASIVSPALVHRTADESGDAMLLLAVPRDLPDTFVTHLRRYRLRAKVTIELVDLATIAVVGPASTSIELPDTGSWFDDPTWGVPARRFVGDHDLARELVRTELPLLGVHCADPDTLEALRIDAGVPGLHDLVPGRMPAEVGGMVSAVALDAGCYLGQEPVARLYYRGRANRTLRRADLDAEPPAGLHAAAASYAAGTDDASRTPHPSLLEPLALVADDDPNPRRAAGLLTTWGTRPDGTIAAFAIARRELSAGARLALVHARDSTVTIRDDADALSPTPGGR